MSQTTYSSARAIASADLQIEETGADVIVFDTRRGLFHFLNATAHSILNACNGSNSVRDIAVTLAGQFNAEDVDTIVGDVAETILQFRDKGLVTYVVDDPHLQQAATGPAAESPLLAVSVSGSSMFPALLSGDKVLVKKSSMEECAPGEIVVWMNDMVEYIAHRVLSVEASAAPPFLVTKGDLCFEPDPPVEFDRVLGKIVAVLREGEVKWVKELDGKNGGQPDGGDTARAGKATAAGDAPPSRKPSYKRMMVLDLREISAESIRNIESVEEISMVLLSPGNAHAWADVPARDVKAVLTVPEDYWVYTGQPELLPDMLEFLEAPLRLVVSGQLFLTAFQPAQIAKALGALVLNGQAYVSSDEVKAALQPLTDIVSGEIRVVPGDHNRWIGQSILGPEYVGTLGQRALVAVGELTISDRMGGVPDGLPLFK